MLADRHGAFADAGGKPLVGFVEEVADFDAPRADSDLRRSRRRERRPAGRPPRRRCRFRSARPAQRCRRFRLTRCREALVGFLEVEDDFAGLGAERRGAVGDAGGDALVGGVEDAAEFAGAGFELLGAVGDAGDELFVGRVEDAAEFGGAGGERVGGFADAHAEPLVGIVEVAQDVAGAGGQRPAVSMARATSCWSASSKTRAISPARVAPTCVPADFLRRAAHAACSTSRAARGGELGRRLPRRPGDVFGAGEQGARGLFGALGDPPVGIGEGLAGLLVQRGGDFHDLVAQRAGDDHGALFQHLADIVDAGRQRALHGAGALLDDAGLAAERLLDLLDIGGDGLRRCRRACRRSCRCGAAIATSISRRASASLPRSSSSARASVSRPSASLRDVAGDDVVELRRGRRRPSAGRPAAPATGFRGLRRSSGPGRRPAGRRRARFGELVRGRLRARGSGCRGPGPASRPGRHQPVDAAAAFGELVEVVFERLGEHVAAFGELLRPGRR